jgi:predicted enzyme related to lactoylglutathione lyase
MDDHMRILRTYGRLWVDDLDQALPFLRELVGREPDLQFAFDNVKAAAIGNLLVIDVPQEERSRYPGTATVVVSDLDELTRKLTAHGGQITVPESRSETGRFLYARHADGAEVEYVEWRPELVERVLG